MSESLQVVNDLNTSRILSGHIAKQIDNDFGRLGITMGRRLSQPDYHGHLVVHVLRVHALAGYLVPPSPVRNRQREVQIRRFPEAALAAACRAGGDAARCSYCFLLGLCSLVERNKILLTGHVTHLSRIIFATGPHPLALRSRLYPPMRLSGSSQTWGTQLFRHHTALRLFISRTLFCGLTVRRCGHQLVCT
nr:MAG TPA: hypothetical protein [Caudoviricetes sp.]